MPAKKAAFGVRRFDAAFVFLFENKKTKAA
jgi:hypothetical protein